MAGFSNGIRRRAAGVLVVAFVLVGAAASPICARTPSIRLTLPAAAVAGLPFTLDFRAAPRTFPDTTAFTLRILNAAGDTVRVRRGRLIGTAPVSLTDVVTPEAGFYRVVLEADGRRTSRALRVIPGFLTLLPPLIAIAAALLFRHVLLALAAGSGLGALFLTGYNPFQAVLYWIDTLILNTVASRSNASVILVILVLGGMIGVISRNGGVYGIVDLVTRWAKSPRSGQLATWALGLLIFFEGYINTLVVGHTMRPVTDRLKISREKLSFIVDSTAAPVASVALVSGWIGFEVGLIGDTLASVHLNYNAYGTFIETIPYRFYPLLMLFFVFLVAYQARDFGPMLAAERRSRSTGKLLADGAVSLGDDERSPVAGDGRRSHWLYAMAPLALIVAITFWGLWYTGRQAMAGEGFDAQAADLWTVVGRGDGSVALLWGAVIGTMAAIASTVGFRRMSLSECLDAWVEGGKSVLFAIVILILAWSLVAACRELSTAAYIVELATGVLSPHLMPVMTFFLAAVVSFATGTSWGTMALLMPLVVPLAVSLSAEAGTPGEGAHVILLGTISSVLSGAVWGDHCSPISDTTIMSSMASGADHVDHVRTQMPYALLVGCTGMAVGDIPAAYGLSPWISLALGGAVLFGVLRLFGRRSEEENS